MARPLVSTIIPTYNYGRYVCEAVESVLRQTYQPVEIVVVDDGSNDDTRGRLEAFGSSIRYIYQDNKGLSAARNTGIRAARGEWLAFLDADDTWHPRKLQLQADAIADLPDVSFVGSPAIGPMVDDLDPHPEVRRLTVRDFIISTPLTGSSAMARRGCFDKVGLFDEDLRSVEDRDMWLKLAAEFPSATVVSPCVAYRSHPGQMSRNPVRMLKSLELVLKRFFDQHPDHAKLRPIATAFLHRDASIAYLEAEDRLAALAHMLRSIVAYPVHLNPRTEKHFRAKVLARLLVGEENVRRLKGLR